MPDKTYELAVFEQDQGQPVVLLHGLISTHRYWRQVIAHLNTKKWHIIAPDLLGFGDSPKPKDAQYDLAEQVECVDRAVRNSFNPPATLVGHSLGAIVALKWAVNRPELFKRVVLSGLPLFSPQTKYGQLASGAETKYVPHERLAKIAIHAFGWLNVLPVLTMRLHKTWPRHIAEDWTTNSRHAHKKIVRNPVLSDEVLKLLKELKIPTQIIVGKYDGMVGETGIKSLRSIARDNNNISLEVISGGHNIPLKFPEVIAQAILQV